MIFNNATIILHYWSWSILHINLAIFGLNVRPPHKKSIIVDLLAESPLVTCPLVPGFWILRISSRALNSGLIRKEVVSIFGYLSLVSTCKIGTNMQQTQYAKQRVVYLENHTINNTINNIWAARSRPNPSRYRVVRGGRLKDVDSEGSFLRISDFKNQIKFIGIQVDGPGFGLTVYESGGFCGLELVATFGEVTLYSWTVSDANFLIKIWPMFGPMLNFESKQK